MKPLISSHAASAESALHALPADGFVTPERVLALILDTLEDAKAEDTVSIDLQGKTSIADHMVVTSGRSHRHVAAIADHVAKALKALGLRRLKVEGQTTADWVLIDAGDVVVHIFRPEVRSFYNLEKMWSAAGPSERLFG